MGNTKLRGKRHDYFTVYPHTCGEHRVEGRRGSGVGGLSPHLWGTLVDGIPGNWNPRFIPTPVGNTMSSESCGSPSTVYPHTCGEHRPIMTQCSVKDGLSPHLWGTPRGRSPGETRCRFIPTPVGNTRNWTRADWCAAVYPHTCGEHRAAKPRPSLYLGLSPHLWGTRPTDHGQRGDVRFIPTPVGNTSPPRGYAPLCTVYPHTCGEHCWTAWPEAVMFGLSPHLWGTHHDGTPHWHLLRFIPTPVGNTPFT